MLGQPSLDAAMQGVTAAYYLVLLMSGSKDFEEADRHAATSFPHARSFKTTLLRAVLHRGGCRVKIIRLMHDR